MLGIHSGALGDVILFTQFLNAIRLPAEAIALVAGGEKARLMKGLGAAEEAIDFHSLPMDEVFTDRPAEACRLPRLLGGCTRLVSCFGQGDALAEGRLAGLCGDPPAAFLPVSPPADWPGHLLEWWASSARPAGADAGAAQWHGHLVRASQGHLVRGGREEAQERDIPATHGQDAHAADAPAWRASGEMLAAADEALGRAGLGTGGRFVALHVGSGSIQKCWPVEGFISLARLMPIQAVFLAGPAEEERWGPQALARLSEAGPLLRSPPLATLAGLLARAWGYVGNDSGPTHLAAALGTPTVAVFGPSDPAHFAPRGGRVRIIHRPNLRELPPEAIAAAVAEVRRTAAPGK